MLRYKLKVKAHGGHLTTQVMFIIFFFLISLNSKASSNFSKNSVEFTNSIYKILEEKDTQIKYFDKVTASNINQTYNAVNNDRLYSKLVNNTYSSISKNKNFYPFKHWITNIRKISNETTVRHLRKYCEYISQQKRNIPVEKGLNIQAQNFCFKKYVQLLTRNLNKNKYLTKYDLNVIGHNLNSILNKYTKNDFYYFLDLIKKKSSFNFTKLSNQITKHFIDKQTVPDVELLKHISISADLTRLIQIKGIETYSIYNVFGDRLKNLINDAFKSADNKKSKVIVLNKTDAVINFYNLNIDHLSIDFTFKKLLSLGKSLSRRSYFKVAKNIFTTITKRKSKYYEKAIFELLWVDIVNNNYKEAFKSIVQLDIIKDVNQLDNSKLKYWIAFTLLKNDIKNYQSIMQNIVDQSPLSFYAVMSAKVLQEKLKQTPDQIYKSLLSDNKFPFSVNKKTFSDKIFKSLKRLKTWAELDSRVFINFESKNLKHHYYSEVNLPSKYKNKSYQQELITYLNAKVLFKKENYLESFKIIYNGLEANKLQLNYNVLSTLFPRPYWKNIKNIVSGFDPIIALSLIRQESGFNPKARSHVGARGLMQLMPATARMYRRSLRKKHLERPNLNIKIGSKYFMDLLNKYDNNLVYALSAYNAGEGRVNHWQNNYLTSNSILHNIENIPFLETRKYVKLIFRNIFFYKLLDSKNQLQDSNNKNRIFNIALGFKQ